MSCQITPLLVSLRYPEKSFQLLKTFPWTISQNTVYISYKINYNDQKSCTNHCYHGLRLPDLNKEATYLLTSCSVEFELKNYSRSFTVT